MAIKVMLGVQDLYGRKQLAQVNRLALSGQHGHNGLSAVLHAVEVLQIGQGSA